MQLYMTHTSLFSESIPLLLHRRLHFPYPHCCDRSHLHYYHLAQIAGHPRLDHLRLGRPYLDHLPHAWSRERMESHLPRRPENTSA
jgi:hypothetical protein